MIRALLALVACAAFAPLSHAATGFAVDSVSCSGTPSIASNNGLFVTCTGDLTLVGGAINDSALVSLRADGSLTLEDITVSAPEVSFVGTLFSLGENAVVTATLFRVDMHGGSVPPTNPIRLPELGSIGLMGEGTIVLIGPDGDSRSSPPDSRFVVSSGDIALGNRTLSISAPVSVSVAGVPLSPEAGFTIVSAPIPEPGTWASVTIGLLVIAGSLRRRARR